MKFKRLLKSFLLVIATFVVFESSAITIPVNYNFFNNGDTVIVTVGDILQFTPSQSQYSVMINSTLWNPTPLNYTITGQENSFSMKDGSNQILTGYLKYTQATAIKQIENEITHVSVFPNPFTSSLKILSPVATTASISTSSGQLIIEKKIQANQLTEIELQEYASGLYFVKANGSIRKFIKE